MLPHLKTVSFFAITFLLSSIAAARTQAQQEEKNKLTVVVTKIKKSTGNILIALCDEKQYTNSKKYPCYKSAYAPVQNEASSVTHTFENVAQGIYAIMIFHDTNYNEILDLNLFGIPKELYGFSNNAKGLFGRPKFEEAAFEIIQGKHIYQYIHL